MTFIGSFLRLHICLRYMIEFLRIIFTFDIQKFRFTNLASFKNIARVILLFDHLNFLNTSSIGFPN